VFTEHANKLVEVSVILTFSHLSAVKPTWCMFYSVY
jgi:hypothetical protein